MANIIDLAIVLKFIRALTLPYNKWEAFRTGVIDAEGEIVVPPKKRTLRQSRSFLKFDLLILKLKRLLGKVPGGKSQLATYAAALWLIREQSNDRNSEELTESLLMEEYEQCVAEIEDNLIEDAPTGNVGGGAIAGVGVGADGEPGVKKKKKGLGPHVLQALIRRKKSAQ